VVEFVPAYSGRNVGDRVYASLPVGGCADTVWADEHLVAPLPDSLGFASGAALVVNDHTAHVALVRRAGLRPGESVLVHGAGGGLGSAAVRIGTALGARVTAVASTPGRRAAAQAAGAERVYGPDDWLDAVRGAGGADVIVDPVGGDVFDASLRALAPEGRLLTLGYVSGRIPSAPANRLLLRNSDVRGVNWLGLISAHPALFRSTAAALAGLLAAGMPGPTVVEYDFIDGARAFADLESRSVVGKAVLRLR
jgi:NADPH2:quinone reductase